MAGNVWQWTASDHEAGKKEIRGGRCHTGDVPSVRSVGLGVRCVLATPSPPGAAKANELVSRLICTD